jgi:hypothetical protein
MRERGLWFARLDAQIAQTRKHDNGGNQAGNRSSSRRRGIGGRCGERGEEQEMRHEGIGAARVNDSSHL